MIDHDLLNRLNLSRGNPAMTRGQLRGRIAAYVNNIWPPLFQTSNSAGFAEWTDTMGPTLAEAEAAFAFNHKLQAYRNALARLSQMRLLDGCNERIEAVDLGEVDPISFDPVLTEIIVQPAVDGLPADDPRVIADEAERDAAQAVIDATPAEVVGFQ